MNVDQFSEKLAGLNIGDKVKVTYTRTVTGVVKTSNPAGFSIAGDTTNLVVTRHNIENYDDVDFEVVAMAEPPDESVIELVYSNGQVDRTLIHTKQGWLSSLTGNFISWQAIEDNIRERGVRVNVLRRGNISPSSN